MVKSKVSKKGTKKQQAKEKEQPKPLSRVLFELSKYFDDEIIPHKNNLYLVGYSLTGGDIYDIWRDDIAASMSNALEKIIIDAAEALDDFGNKLDSAHSEYRERNKDVEKSMVMMVVDTFQKMSPENRIKALETINAQKATGGEV